MSSGIDKDVEAKDTGEEKTTGNKPESMSKDEAKKFYEEKGLDLSPDVPVKPKPIPEFEKSLADKISSKFGDKVRVDYVRSDRIRVTSKREDIISVAKFIRDELKYDHAESVSGVDYPDSKEIEVIYHLGSYTDEKLGRQIFALATRVPREDVPNPGSDMSRTPSLRDIFYSVEFHERECFEMFGVYFEGHPDMRRLLLPEDWADIPPFRKDFKIKGR
ncbi:NADH-ubiquinone oxidoreductase, subunit C [Nitrosotalea sinensis]|uniref:NADH-ubiquinone oxidoreductase, subunit C n=1 Tax=Nitrosotalea sinensis TaxID=1499975 RepID=A0A2H1EFY9_9ARCH|nr:NADH-quinone oxidoreductase subunit C [Candidatus Nitrosotalea sinensis]SHO44473.1 NADH-ubiquinone oxidoreductase, subunit C [Candidatus Nitrosotalea sinensis]